MRYGSHKRAVCTVSYTHLFLKKSSLKSESRDFGCTSISMIHTALIVIFRDGTLKQALLPCLLYTSALGKVLTEMTPQEVIDLMLASGLAKDGKISCILFENKNGTEAISADMYIDCTGDGDLAEMCIRDSHKPVR